MHWHIGCPDDIYQKDCKMRIWTIFLLLFAGVMLQGAPLNVKDFGAVGDGIADDTAAIQKALNEMQRHRKANRKVYVNDYGSIPAWGVTDGPNRELFFPAGKYRITRTLVGGYAVTLRGEKGSVIFTENPDLLMFYMNLTYRGSVRNLTFRGGKTHIFFWTANLDAASFVVEDCRFENSSGYALDSRNYSYREKGKKYPKTVGPFKVIWKEDGMPELVPQKRTGNSPNSTKYILTRSSFVNCAGASSAVTDGVFVSDCTFTSTLPQKCAVFKLSWTGAIYNCTINAAIPADFSEGFISNAGFISNVKALSGTKYGAPLLMYYKKLKNKSIYYHPESITIENCISSSASSGKNAIAYFPAGRPIQLTMRNNREAAGKTVKAVHFDIIPQNDQDLMDDLNNNLSPNIAKVKVKDSHCYVFENNGKEVAVVLPENMKRFIGKGLPQTYRDSFPAVGALIAPPDTTGYKVIDALNFGITYKAAKSDFKNLQKVFAEAAKHKKVLVLLPGRRFDLPEALVIPEQCVIRGEGRTVLHAISKKTGLLKISGQNISLDVTGILFNGGTNAIELSGAGKARFNDCLFYDNRTTFLLRKNGKKPLVTDVFASTAYTPVLVENHGGEFRLSDCWLSMQSTLNQGACLRNKKGGTILCYNICGVPVVFGSWCGRPKWKFSKNVFWVENHGVFRSKNFRYGAEFDGAPGIDNYDAGKILVEGAYISYWYHAGEYIFLRNESAAAQFGLDTAASFGAIRNRKTAFCAGVAPGVFLIGNYPHPDHLLLRKADGSKVKLDIGVSFGK